MDKAVGDHIRERREALHLTQEELLEKLKQRGLDRTASTLSAWENGKHVPVENFETIADALEESPLQLYYHAGFFNKIAGVQILLMLNGLPESDVEYIEGIITAVLNRQKR